MIRNFHTPILIIGNGGAAAHGVMALRNAGYDGRIDLVSDVPGQPFNPMLLPYFLMGKIGRGACHPFPRDFHEILNVNGHFGSPVTGLDASTKTAVLADGVRIDYDQCLAATGAACIVPNLPGLIGAERAFTFRTQNCGTGMMEAVERGGSAVVLGASLVGAKLAEVLAGRGLKVTLIDLADRLLPGTAHRETSLTIQKLLEGKGLKVLLNHRLTGVMETASDIRLHFDGAGQIVADFACVCVGVRPRLDYLDPDQVPIGTGVLVDAAGRTGVEGLYAAGDAAEGLNLLTGRHQWFGLWGKACYQGRAAGLNMAGFKSAYPGALPEYITPLADRIFAGLGDVNHRGPETRTILYRDRNGLVEAVLTFEAGVLVGANLLGGIEALDRLKTALIKRLDFSRLLKKAHPRLSEILAEIINRTKIDFRTSTGNGRMYQ